MSAFAKVLAVFLTAASVCFFAFALLQFTYASEFPNWEAKTKSLTDYVFEQSDEGTWSSKHRRTSESAGQSPVLAKVVRDTLRKKSQEDQANLTQLQERNEQLTQQIAAQKAAMPVEVAAIKAAESELRANFNLNMNEKEVLQSNTVAKVDESQSKRHEVERRRNDIFRLQEQLDEVRTDQVRISRIQEQLIDLIMRAEGELGLLLRRNQQLQAQTQAE